MIGAVVLVALTSCGDRSADVAARPDGQARFEVGSGWNFSPGYDLEHGYVDDYYVISFPVTNVGPVAGTPACQGGIGGRWMPILHLPSVEAGETRWVTGIMRPQPPLRRGEESQGASCS